MWIFPAAIAVVALPGADSDLRPNLRRQTVVDGAGRPDVYVATGALHYHPDQTNLRLSQKTKFFVPV